MVEVSTELRALAERVQTERGFDNSLDVAAEIALFETDADWTAIRANDAGTKVILTKHNGQERTYIARDFTISAAARTTTAAALRARAALLDSPIEKESPDGLR